MDKYMIIPLQDDSMYSKMIIMCDANSPFVYIPNILIDLHKEDINGKILVDQLLHSGNTEKRFFCIDMSSNENHYYSLHISKDSQYRKIACEYLKNKDFVEHSILTSIQKRMINKGIAI